MLNLLINTVILGSIAIALALLGSSAFIVKQWEKAAVLRFGKIIKIVETGARARSGFSVTL